MPGPGTGGGYGDRPRLPPRRPPPAADPEAQPNDSLTDNRTRSQPRILERMTQQPDPDLREDMDAMLAAAGITVTEHGKTRARAKLAEAAAQRDPQRRAALRERLGLPPATTE